MPAFDDSSPAAHALSRAVREVEQHAHAAGWDAQPTLYALVATLAATAQDPDLSTLLPADVLEAAAKESHHLLSVEQEGWATGDGLEESLALIAWPPTVAGAALVIERVIVPPEVEAAMPQDPDEAVEYLAKHPRRQDVRLAVGVLRTGERWCALRHRSYDDDADVVSGADLVPGLADALAATLR